MCNSVNNAEVIRVLVTFTGALTGPNSQVSRSVQGIIPLTATGANVTALIGNPHPTTFTGAPSLLPPGANASMTGPLHMLSS